MKIIRFLYETHYLIGSGKYIPNVTMMCSINYFWCYQIYTNIKLDWNKKYSFIIHLMVSITQAAQIMIFVAIIFIHLVNISPITWLAIINFNITHFPIKARISSLKYNTVFFFQIESTPWSWFGLQPSWKSRQWFKYILSNQQQQTVTMVTEPCCDWTERKSSKLCGSSLPRRERKHNQALLVTGAVQYLKYYHCYRQIEFTKLFLHIYMKKAIKLFVSRLRCFSFKD